jgi:Domain of unknown function (DUF4193)
MTTTSDYDARHVAHAEAQDTSTLRELASTRPVPSAVAIDDDPNEMASFELPGADLSGEELSVTVIPQRSDEFTCSSCFLVQHRNRLRRSSSGLPVCADCA